MPTSESAEEGELRQVREIHRLSLARDDVRRDQSDDHQRACQQMIERKFFNRGIISRLVEAP